LDWTPSVLLGMTVEIRIAGTADRNGSSAVSGDSTSPPSRSPNSTHPAARRAVRIASACRSYSVSNGRPSAPTAGPLSLRETRSPPSHGDHRRTTRARRWAIRRGRYTDAILPHPGARIGFTPVSSAQLAVRPLSPDTYRPAAQRSPGHRRGSRRGSYAATSGPPSALKCRNGKAALPHKNRRWIRRPRRPANWDLRPVGR